MFHHFPLNWLQNSPSSIFPSFSYVFPIFSHDFLWISHDFPRVFWGQKPVLPSHPVALRHALRAAPLLGGTPTPWSLGGGKIDGRCVGCLWDIIYIYVCMCMFLVVYVYMYIYNYQYICLIINVLYIYIL